LSGLPAPVKTHLGLLLRRVAVTSVIGFVLAVLQLFTGTANVLSSNAFNLTVAALAGVGAWPHAIEAHYTVRLKLRRRTGRKAARGRGATPRSMIRLHRHTSRGAARTRRRLACPATPMPTSATLPSVRSDTRER
jgi:hypothetical protein